MKNTFILVALLQLWSEASFAACGTIAFGLTAPQSTINFTSNATPSASVTVTRTGATGSCNFFIGFSKGASGTYAPRKLFNAANFITYQLYQNAGFTNVLQDKPDSSTATNFLSNNFTGTQTTKTTSYFPQRSAVTGYEYYGTYSDSISAHLYTGSITGSYTLVSTATITYQHSVPKLIDISLVNTSAAFNIADTTQTFSFGTLNTPPPAQSADLIIKYNAGYGVNLCSTNTGQMKHSSLAKFVPYTMTLNSTSVNFATSCGTYVVTGASFNTTGVRLPMTITPGSIGTVPSGSYSDTITVTISTTE